MGERFILSALKNWHIHRIAMEYNISPVEVKMWDAEEVLEALAYIGLMEKEKAKNNQK